MWASSRNSGSSSSTNSTAAPATGADRTIGQPANEPAAMQVPIWSSPREAQTAQEQRDEMFARALAQAEQSQMRVEASTSYHPSHQPTASPVKYSGIPTAEPLSWPPPLRQPPQPAYAYGTWRPREEIVYRNSDDSAEAIFLVICFTFWCFFIFFFCFWLIYW
jgi:hypothetical protein